MSDSSARSAFGSSKIEFLILDKYKGKLSGCTLVTGFYGIGKVGFISVNHMVEKTMCRKNWCDTF